MIGVGFGKYAREARSNGESSPKQEGILFRGPESKSSGYTPLSSRDLFEIDIELCFNPTRGTTSMAGTTYRGSEWGIWDLHVQSILDDEYVSLASYAEEAREADPFAWKLFVDKVGTEENALLFDSKDYFKDVRIPQKERYQNYVRTFFAFIESFRPSVRCVGITDHNYSDELLLDMFIDFGKQARCKALCGLEINVTGVHVLLFFGSPPCGQPTYSSGVRTFLNTIGVMNPKTDGVLTVCKKGLHEVIDAVIKENGLWIFAHCNSDNGLFQERGKTDRTYLASVFNYRNPVLLQTKSKKSMDSVLNYIRSKEDAFRSLPIGTLGSDSRSLLRIGETDEDGNNCWVKADPGFEGLRQGIFEPKTRIRIEKSKPVDPPFRIAKVEMNFPSGTKIQDDPFCLTGQRSLPLSPNYTCFIGGRGTGKSTILNLINEKVNPGQRSFLTEQSLTTIEDVPLLIKDAVVIDDDKEEQIIEFLSQNQVEEFATNAKELTAAIYKRLEKRNNGKVKLLGDTLTARTGDVQRHITLVKSLSALEKSRLERTRQVETNRRIVDSFQSAEYQTIATSLSSITDGVNSILSARKSHNDLLFDLKRVIELHPRATKVGLNDYETAYNRLVDQLSSMVAESEGLDFGTIEEQLSGLQKDVIQKEGELKQYLKSKDLTDENIQDVTKASQNISAFEGEIETLNKSIGGLEKEISTFALENVTAAKSEFEGAVKSELEGINKQLAALNDQVKAIVLKLEYDKESAGEKLYELFKSHFSLDPTSMKTKEASLKEHLLKHDPLACANNKQFVDLIVGGDAAKATTQAQRSLLELFENPSNFDQFKMLARMVSLDLVQFKTIEVFYDNKPLRNSSFGQRCTAALVILLSLGNNPIIIDEPEAHLDSLLIANYLVDLIKVSKQNRQIVFATHNANLVVNGDAELIYYLEIGDDQITRITPTTIENLDQRNLIIGLEGGREAFALRENKYKQPSKSKSTI